MKWVTIHVKYMPIDAGAGYYLSEDGNMLSTSISILMFIDFAADGLKKKKNGSDSKNIDSIKHEAGRLF